MVSPKMFYFIFKMILQNGLDTKPLALKNWKHSDTFQWQSLKSEGENCFSQKLLNNHTSIYMWMAS